MRAVMSEVQPDLVVILGDEIDAHALSFYPQHPSLPNATQELKEARECIKGLVKILGDVDVLAVDSNHTSRVYRKGKSAGIPREMILPYDALLGVDWPYAKDWVIPLPNGTHLLCSHQKGNYIKTAGQQAGMNIVAGHFHKRASVEFWTDNRNREFFAVQAPCLIDFDSPAYSYDENTPNRPNLGCTVITECNPVNLRMFVDENNRWTGDIWSSY